MFVGECWCCGICNGGLLQAWVPVDCHGFLKLLIYAHMTGPVQCRRCSIGGVSIHWQSWCKCPFFSYSWWSLPGECLGSCGSINTMAVSVPLVPEGFELGEDDINDVRCPGHTKFLFGIS